MEEIMMKAKGAGLAAWMETFDMTNDDAGERPDMNSQHRVEDRDE